jgi:predicted Zn-dependent peptidase
MNMRSLPLIAAFLAASCILHAQSTDYKPVSHTSQDGKYTYTTVPGDPLQARIYTLKNGLTVMMSVNKSEPRIQTLIATKAGSKNDPSYNTGLAHYLEHLLFKGTDKFGSKDFSKEKPLLDKIEDLFEQYKHVTDPAQRKAMYHVIDSVSGEAAKFAIANEYDKLTSAIGAKGTNAQTSVERTIYINDIPQNQLEKWLVIEGERFRKPVFRLFHTELEAVYEEKNIGLDNDDRKMYETLMGAMFRNHPYGTQTTIGTVEHLKNPSLVEIQKYFDTYYVPNNMAVVLAGDLDPDATIALIDKNFGSLQPKPVPAFTFAPETPRSSPQEINVYGPDAENMAIAYRFPGAGTHDELLLEVTDLLLAYKTAGLIDLNLKKQQKVLDASSSPLVMKDYSVHWFSGTPKQGQSLEEVRDLLLGQIDKLKKGEFDEAALSAVIRNLKVDQIKQYESNSGRAFSMLDAFTLGEDWAAYAHKLDALSRFTKNDVVAFANKYYGKDYVVIYKRTGEDKSIVKVEKPAITPVDVNSGDQSPFLKNVLAMKAPEIKPDFIDYQKDITRVSLKNGIPVYYRRNTDNELFSLYYVFDMGRKNDKRLPIAIKYLQYLGTDKYSADQLSKEFFKLGCEFGVSSGEDQVYVSLSGLKESYEPALKLFEEFLANLKPDQKALDGLIAQEMKGRVDAKRDKQTVLWSGLRSYAVYGKNNPFTDRLSESQVRALKADDLVSYLKSLSGFKHRVLYYGPNQPNAVVASLDSYHRTPATLRDYPPAVNYARNDMNENTVYFVNFDMVQAEVVWLNKSRAFDPVAIPVASLFNEYYGGGMSSVIFQNIRESKALAYSTFEAYQIPAKQTDPFYILSYLGTQADKLSEAIPAMNALLTDMPRTEQSFVTAREGLRNQLETERVTKADILFNYLAAEKRGLDHDIRRDIYANLDALTLDDLQKFHDTRYKGVSYAYCVLGSKSKVDMNLLKKYGKVVELSLEDIFGY